MPLNETPTINRKGTKMTRLDLTKKIASITVGFGTGKIVGQVIKNNTSPDSVVDHVSILAASIVLGQMAADKTTAYTDQKIDEIVAWWKNPMNVKKNHA